MTTNSLSHDNVAHSPDNSNKTKMQNLLRRTTEFILGIVLIFGATSLVVSLALLFPGSFLAHWYGWLLPLTIATGCLWFIRRHLHSIVVGSSTAVALLAAAVLSLAVGQYSWSYTATQPPYSVDAHPIFDVVFVGHSWHNPAGRAQIASVEDAFRVFQSSGWWSMLRSYGVHRYQLAGCKVSPSRPASVQTGTYIASALAGSTEGCPGWTGGQWVSPSTNQNVMMVVFAGPNSLVTRHLKEEGWNTLVRLKRVQFRVAVILPGSLQYAVVNHRLQGFPSSVSTTLTLSHELAEGTTGLGTRPVRVQASTLSRFILVAGAITLYASSSQLGLITSMYQSQPTDVMQIADICSPNQPSFVPSLPSLYRIVDGVGMPSLWNLANHSCQNINHGEKIPFPT
ncbi:MAG: hypothetical protein ACYDHP_12360 [Ferrimicrobium sp.]